VTHVNDGFDVLGVRVRRYVSPQDRPKVRIRPSQNAQTRVQATVQARTDRRRFRDKPWLKFSALNAVLRGWSSYDRHGNAKQTAKALDFWVNRRVLLWLQKRHRLPPRRVLALYTQRQEGPRYNWGLRNGEAWRFRYGLSDQPLTTYRSRTPANPYVVGDWATELVTPEVPLPAYVWLGQAKHHAEWRALKAASKAEPGAQGERCGSRMDLDLHQLKARRYGGRDLKANAQLLGEPCHVQTPTSGDPHRLQ
jgi:RNA-directed DNA polymerase